MKNNTFDPAKTKELQNDWQSYGRGTVYFSLVIFLITVASMLYHTFL